MKDAVVHQPDVATLHIHTHWRPCVLRLTDCVGETARNQQLIVVEATSSLRRCLLRLIGVYWAFEQVRTWHDLDADVSRQRQQIATSAGHVSIHTCR